MNERSGWRLERIDAVQGKEMELEPVGIIIAKAAFKDFGEKIVKAEAQASAAIEKSIEDAKTHIEAMQAKLAAEAYWWLDTAPGASYVRA